MEQRSVSKKTRVTVLLIAGSALFALAVSVKAGFGFMFNTEACLPTGWYVAVPIVGPLRVGQTVVMCPLASNPVIRFAINRHWLGASQQSFCPGRLTPYVKQVFATSGDRVRIARDGVRVDGRAIPDTASLPTTGDGHTPMPHRMMGEFTVAPGQVLLLATDAKNAFDGRYFGTVPVVAVRRLAFKLP